MFNILIKPTLHVGQQKHIKQAQPPSQMASIMPRPSVRALAMLHVCPDYYHSGGGLHVHLEMEHVRVVDDDHREFEGKLAPSFEEGEPFALPLQMDVVLAPLP
jgi:hypothetical protein